MTWNLNVIRSCVFTVQYFEATIPHNNILQYKRLIVSYCNSNINKLKLELVSALGGPNSRRYAMSCFLHELLRCRDVSLRQIHDGSRWPPGGRSALNSAQLDHQCSKIHCISTFQCKQLRFQKTSGSSFIFTRQSVS